MSVATAISQITTENISTVFPEIMRDIIAEIAPPATELNYGRTTRPTFGFHFGHPEECNVEKRPWVYLYNIGYSEDMPITCGIRKNIEATLGMRRSCTKADSKYWAAMWDKLKNRFGLLANDFTYTITIDTNAFTGARLSDFGIYNVRTLGDTQRVAPAPYNKCGCTWRETILQFSIEYKT